MAFLLPPMQDWLNFLILSLPTWSNLFFLCFVWQKKLEIWMFSPWSLFLWKIYWVSSIVVSCLKWYTSSSFFFPFYSSYSLLSSNSRPCICFLFKSPPQRRCVFLPFLSAKVTVRTETNLSIKQMYCYICWLNSENHSGDLFLATVKFTFIKIITDYKYYIPLNLPHEIVLTGTDPTDIVQKFW